MKYPFVLFYRLDKYSYVDKFFISNSDNFDCTIYFISKIDKIKYLFDPNYHLLITFGNSEEYDFIFNELPLRFNKYWYKKTTEINKNIPIIFWKNNQKNNNKNFLEINFFLKLH